MTDHTETARHLLDRHGLPEDVIDGALALHIQEVTALVRAEADKPRQLIESRMARNVRRIRYRQVADLIEAAALGVPLAAAPAEPKADRLVPGGHRTRHHPPTRRTDMTDAPRVTMSTDELAIELFITSQVVTGRGEAERLLKQIKDRHAHELAERIRQDTTVMGEAGDQYALCYADVIDPEAQQ